MRQYLDDQELVSQMLPVDRWMMHDPDVTILITTVVSLTLICTVLSAKCVGVRSPS